MKIKIKDIARELIWILKGKPAQPPHSIKVKLIKNYAKISKFKILIETGTYQGDMVYNQLDNFDKIYSIELQKDLYKKAKFRFKKYRKVILLQWDSSIKLKKLLTKIKIPSIFWLDAHYSGGITAKGNSNSPITSELKEILKSKVNNIILIDDANCFGNEGYPKIKQVEDMIDKTKYIFKIDLNIIQIIPKKY